jgi:hypothetical protein
MHGKPAGSPSLPDSLFFADKNLSPNARFPKKEPYAGPEIGRIFKVRFDNS